HVDVVPRPQESVRARGDADEIRVHADRFAALALEHTRRLTAAYRQVGVLEHAIGAASFDEQRGQPVGPPAKRAVGPRLIADTLGEAVSDGHIAQSLPHRRHGIRTTRDDGLLPRTAVDRFAEEVGMTAVPGVL